MTEQGHRTGLSRLLVGLAVIAVGVHLFGLYRPSGPPSPKWFPHADKFEHVVGFGAPVLAILLARHWFLLRHRRRELDRRFTLTVVVAFALHAVVSELIQLFFYTHRTGDPFDALADWIGVLLGWIAARWVIAHQRRRSARSTSSDRPLPVRTD